MRFRVAVILVLSCQLALVAQVRLTQQDAARFQAKLARIEAFGNARTARRTATIDGPLRR